MRRRTIIASIGTVLSTGCLGSLSSSGGTPPNTEFNIEYEGEQTVKVAHNGSDTVEDGSTAKLGVEVNGERVDVTYHGETYAWVLADDDQLEEGQAAAYEYPFSIGNVVTAPAKPGDTVQVVWYAQGSDETEVLVETTVSQPTTESETTEDSSSSNEMSPENETSAENETAAENEMSSA